MKTIKINDSYELTLPDGYVKTYIPREIVDIPAWCAALESGQYEQGLGRLAADNKFCCLGVGSACGAIKYNTHQFVIENGIGAWVNVADENEKISLVLPNNAYFGDNGNFLPGVRIECKYHNIVNLTTCNDDLQLNFNEISMIIKEIWTN